MKGGILIMKREPVVASFDGKVRYLGKEYFIKGRMSTGYAILMDIQRSGTDQKLF